MTLVRDTVASSIRRRLLTALVLAGACQPALAAFPERPITLVIPYPPGGAADVGGVELGERLGEVVERPALAGEVDLLRALGLVGGFLVLRGLGLACGHLRFLTVVGCF